ncbi:flagellar assembly protein FliW [Paenibacillus pabuli]|uniref:flagellar assembly protein FliW n=1 Tax=Paenibacillus pabuli TaxID=1472 RepID=UPI00078077EB|nr:flagellar assembly protein FliW [Paenibacillus pabuli]
MSQHNRTETPQEQLVKETYIFPKGILGFEELKSFELQQHDEVFSLFGAVEEHSVAFVTVNPFDFDPEYEFELSPESVEDLGVTDASDIQVRCIVTLHEEIRHATANLLAPVVFNTHKKMGKQIVLQNTSYKTKHALWRNEGFLNKDGGI